MQWLDMPPGAPMQVTQHGKRVLELEGPTTGARVMSGMTAGFGAVFAGFALRFLRLPFPGPIKLIPVFFAAVGTGLAALGVGGATARCSVRVTPDGIAWAWRYGPLPSRRLRVGASEVRAVEVERLMHRSSNSSGHHDTTWLTFCVRVVTNEGKAFALDEHMLETQARLRKQQVEALLAGAPVSRRRPARTPKRRGR